MVSKEACYKGPPFKTRFHELDGCQASGKAKNDARRSVAIASGRDCCGMTTNMFYDLYSDEMKVLQNSFHLLC